MISVPSISEQLTKEHINFLSSFRISCAHTIISMLKQSQSGHPGGSLSSLDFLVLLYAFIISQSGEKIVVSNGHISPAVYSVLAELGYISKQEVINTFRQVGSIFEGHITRHVPGIEVGTGPLGVGASVSSGFAHAEKLKGENKNVYCMVGDGECQEGMVYEMMHYANKYKLNNLIVFMDYNQVQLTASLQEIMPVDFHKVFLSANWHVIEVDGHDYQEMWMAIHEAQNHKDGPVLIMGKTIMGKGVEFMEEEGREHRSTWHGNAPKPEDCDKILKTLIVRDEERNLIDSFVRDEVKWHPKEPFIQEKNKIEIDVGNPNILKPETITDCRSAYGNALKDISDRNPQILGMTADLGGSVKTNIMQKAHPGRVLEVGIAEQQMVSCAGGLSLSGFVPFCSTFGAFMTSRAKDQARVNDINRTNVKMVSTHCGLSVGEDGPTHQAIDDMGSFMGFYNTIILEPADPNQCDHMVRYVAKNYGNFYIRMGRAKLSILTKEDGNPFFDEAYDFQPGKADILREGTDISIFASGPLVEKVISVRNSLKDDISIEVICLNSPSNLDEKKILTSLKKTGKGFTIEDHNPKCGYGVAVSNILAKTGGGFILESIGVTEYQLSGKAEDLYIKAGLGEKNIEEKVRLMVHG